MHLLLLNITRFKYLYSDHCAFSPMNFNKFLQSLFLKIEILYLINIEESPIILMFLLSLPVLVNLPLIVQDLVIVLEAMRIIAVALSPVTPNLCLRIYKQLGYTEDQFHATTWVRLSSSLLVFRTHIYSHK